MAGFERPDNEPGHTPVTDTIFPPDRWFIQNEAERRSVIAEMALTGHLPKKLEYSA